MAYELRDAMRESRARSRMLDEDTAGGGVGGGGVPDDGGVEVEVVVGGASCDVMSAELTSSGWTGCSITSNMSVDPRLGGAAIAC